ncbi:protein CHROMATIN REMODELING 19 [Syzygium oleosum]|uniref:protein CHROMATIN REMODELING 19 n=1 Tax=Syzygium oleosum TaxID=219896 RepID=UPI0011D2131B|nr:protein CHROMATIN REMODELING 19 [Syzygium oleosum]XP_056165484.1 protein CHROMATIN REMODELING 19 [Syzygium oleosum]
MKRALDELTEEDWGDLSRSFKPSRVLRRTPSPPPPIESFAFSGKSRGPRSPSSSGRGIVEIGSSDNLEDDDVELVGSAAPAPASRGRRFVVDDDDDAEEEEEEGEEAAGAGSKVESDGDLVDVYDISSAEDEKGEEAEVEEPGEEEDAVEDDDVVGKALQKCAKISSDLKKALYGSSVASCEHYSEVEASSNRIVTQDDVDAACGSDDTDFQPVLKPYQLVGVNFLLLLHRKGVGGAILADEMGLGKTIQAITYLTLLKHLNNDPGPHLIVCPASLLENWERELKRWCPSFSALQYHGANRSIYSKELTSLSKAGLPPPFNVLLVCYSLFERHSVQQKDDRKILRRWRWSCVLMDEAHALKDKNSYRWKNLMSVARNANQRLMLTGTPLQNDLHELWSLLEFMMPDLFATEDVDLKKLLNAEDRALVSRMKSILGPFILRRLKSDVMRQLVPKIQKVEFVTMDQQQEEAYVEAIEEYRAASGARLAKFSGDCLRNINKILPKRQISNYFVQFRKIANHPLLVRRLYDDGDIVCFAKKLYQKGAFGFECGLERVIDEMKKYSDFSIHQLLLCYGIDGILSEEHAMLSAKCRALAELLPALHKGGHRVLIFSQWTSMLDILEWILELIGVTYRRLDGSTQVTDRQSIVDTFNNDTSIFACLLSTRAGGQGLNLTGADTVVIHDMDFNPQIDRQAEDRCHRIGQIKPVTIYRLVTKGTVDENIYEIAKRKLVLDAAVLESGLEVDNEKDTSEKTMGEILSALLLR